MVQFIPPPDSGNLLPPLLACLPTAFASPRPPPALLPLLSPILRQRLHLLSSSSASSSTDSWLALLCWESGPASKLVDLVSESDAFELHPVSGEIDYGPLDPISYRRLDEETLQAKVEIPDLGLIIIYLWCEGDDVGEGSGWRVSEVRPREDRGEAVSSYWCLSVAEADEKAQEKDIADAMQNGEKNSIGQEASNKSTLRVEENDEDYWAQYDITPGARSGPPKPSARPSEAQGRRERSTSEAEYFDSYGSVQPEMDNEGDPDEANGESLTESTLNGNTLSATHRPSSVPSRNHQIVTSRSLHTVPEIRNPQGNTNRSFSTATGSDSMLLNQLDGSSGSYQTADIAIKHHVSTSLKNLFKLCRSTGMEMEEFDGLVRKELDILSLVAEDE